MPIFLAQILNFVLCIDWGDGWGQSDKQLYRYSKKSSSTECLYLYLSVNTRITLPAAANAPADNTQQGLKITWRKYNKYFKKGRKKICKNLVHCKDTIPKIGNKYSQKRICAASVPISTFMCLCLWAIYIFRDRFANSAAGKYVDRFWQSINRSQADTWMLNVEIETQAAQFLFQEYINRIFVAV